MHALGCVCRRPCLKSARKVKGRFDMLLLAVSGMKGQAQPHQMQLRCVCAAAAQAHPAVGGHLHRGGRPEGHLHQLLPAHGAPLPAEALPAALVQGVRMSTFHSAAPVGVLASPLLRAEGQQACSLSSVDCTSLSLLRTRSCGHKECVPDWARHGMGAADMGMIDCLFQSFDSAHCPLITCSYKAVRRRCSAAASSL